MLSGEAQMCRVFLEQAKFSVGLIFYIGGIQTVERFYKETGVEHEKCFRKILQATHNEVMRFYVLFLAETT